MRYLTAADMFEADARLFVVVIQSIIIRIYSLFPFLSPYEAPRSSLAWKHHVDVGGVLQGSDRNLVAHTPLCLSRHVTSVLFLSHIIPVESSWPCHFICTSLFFFRLPFLIVPCNVVAAVAPTVSCSSD